MPEQMLQQQDARTNSLVEAIMQYFQSPLRQQEAQAMPNAVAAQQFDAVTGQYRGASRNNAFDLAQRGLVGGSAEQQRVGALNRAFEGGMAGVEGQRQASIAQNMAALQQAQHGALNQAFAQNPFTQGALGAMHSGITGQTQWQGTLAALNQQGMQQQSLANQQLGQALGNPLNLWAMMLQAQS